MKEQSFLSGRQDSNLRPLDPQPSALPGCATSRNVLPLNQIIHSDFRKANVIAILSNSKKHYHRFNSVCLKTYSGVLINASFVMLYQGLSSVLEGFFKI